MLVSVALPVPFLAPLTYRTPDEARIVRGARVIVPLGHRLVTGCVLGVWDDATPVGTTMPRGDSASRLKSVREVIDDEPFLPEDVLCLAEWVAEYYMCGVGEAIAAAMPPFAWMESRPSFRATDAGRFAAETTSGIAKRALELVIRRGTVERSTLVAQLRGRSGARPAAAVSRDEAESVLRVLERGGALERVHALTGGLARFKTVRRAVIVLGGVDAGAREALTEKQRAAIEQLEASPDGLELRALESGGISADVITRLEARGLVSIEHERVDRDPFDHLNEDEAAAVREAEKAAVCLTEEQSGALDLLRAAFDRGEFRVALLHGVTGSGKTEVYRRLAQLVSEGGRTALILVPEIALTPAVAATFRHTFGNRVAIQHSALSDGERHDQWHRIRRGEVNVVVGTRSAVFAPLAAPGLIIVDEEHDTSYKQEETPRYNGRDVAIVRARRNGALVVLGSATPALETYHNALEGRYQRIVLSGRVLERPLADVRIVDMRQEYAEGGPDVILSRLLRERLAARLSLREQAIVLLNRRGYASAVFCRHCAGTLECPNCSVSLTVYRAARQARCHYCDFSRPVPERCGSCGGEYLEYIGVGTERVEAEIVKAFPAARVTRVDRDTIRRRGAITRVLRRFAGGELDVLVGTQMLAKGHDFPAVTLVGVISADVGLGLADFRAAERTFQLLTQVAGRAGRGDRPGEAVIQTLYPRHYSILHARAQDYGAFFADEIHYRRAMWYPPVVSLVNVIVRGRSLAEATAGAAALARDVRSAAGATLRVLGPAPAPLQRLRGEYREQFFLKGTNRRAMREALSRSLAAHPELERRITIDVDPLNVL